MKNFGILLLVLMQPLLSQAAPELKGNPDELSAYLLQDKKTLTITGHGEEKVEADNAVVSLVVKTKANKLHAALEKNRAIRTELKQKLEKAGITAARIQTSKFSSTPSYGWFGDKPTNYDVSNEVKITIGKEEELSLLAEIVDTKEEVYFGNTSIKYSKKSDAKAHALEKSLSDVLAVKAQYEKALGIKLVAIGISEQAVAQDNMSQQRQPSALRKQSVSSNASAPLSYESGQDDSGGFGELVYRAHTTVVYLVK